MSKRARQGLPVLLPVLRLLRQYKLRLAGASIALLFTAGATLSLAWGVQVLIDQGFGGESSADLRSAIGLLIIIAVARSCRAPPPIRHDCKPSSVRRSASRCAAA